MDIDWTNNWNRCSNRSILLGDKKMKGAEVAGIGCIVAGGYFLTSGVVSSIVNTTGTVLETPGAWNATLGTVITPVTADANLNVGSVIYLILGAFLLIVGVILLRKH